MKNISFTPLNYNITPDRLREQYNAVRAIFVRLGMERLEDNILYTTEENTIREDTWHRQVERWFGEEVIRIYTGSMSKMKVTKEEICKQIGRLKFGKQPGPDQIKGEIYKCMMDSDLCIDKMYEQYT